MAYNEELADRVRKALVNVPNVEEKKMFRGVTFMVNDKMCINISGDNLMCRIGVEEQEIQVEKAGVQQVIMRDMIMKDFVYVSCDSVKTKKELDYWVKLCLAFNKIAKASKPKKAKKKIS